ncbi:RNA polymerase sigma factor [Nibrella viscosa]|uniref:RNA polymerase sigma factor n=1 Tax=Nibrella viscosa TaxID=1084524 RepID=A0ABP8KU21_9BACT
MEPAPLLEALQQGDNAAFGLLYEQTNRRVYNTALGYVRNREDAEDITQEVYVEVFRSVRSFTGESSLTTWLYRITVNKSLDFLKRRQRKKRFAVLTSLFTASPGGEQLQPATFFHPGIALEQQENADILFRAIDKLPDKQKTAYLLTRVEGLSHIETAGVLNTSVGAVESLLSRATDNLRKHLAGYYKKFIEP